MQGSTGRQVCPGRTTPESRKRALAQSVSSALRPVLANLRGDPHHELRNPCLEVECSMEECCRGKWIFARRPSGRAPGGFCHRGDSVLLPRRCRWPGCERMRRLPDMARGIGENPARSPRRIFKHSTYPATREEIVQHRGDNEARVEVINFLKSLPKERYDSY